MGFERDDLMEIQGVGNEQDDDAPGVGDEQDDDAPGVGDEQDDDVSQQGDGTYDPGVNPLEDTIADLEEEDNNNDTIEPLDHE